MCGLRVRSRTRVRRASFLSLFAPELRGLQGGLTGRDYVSPDDVKALALPTLRHRIQLRPEAEMEGVTADSVITAVLAHVPVPR